MQMLGLHCAFLECFMFFLGRYALDTLMPVMHSCTPAADVMLNMSRM